MVTRATLRISNGGITNVAKQETTDLTAQRITHIQTEKKKTGMTDEVLRKFLPDDT